MAFQVKTTARTKRDLDAILQWILVQSAGDAGIQWFQGMRDAIASLTESPTRCAFAPENKIFLFDVRQLLYGHSPHVYRILFTVESDTVTVLHIRHGRRQPVAAGL